MASDAQLVAELDAVRAQLVKAQAEIVAAANPQPKTFAITALQGIFADDTGLAVGDIAHVVVVRGRVGQMSPNGIWGDIADGTIIEYWTTHGVTATNKAVEVFYGG